MDYGSSFHGLLRADAGAAWTAYVEHPFVRGLEDGTLPQRSFLHYLQQDYVYLIHYTRAWALAAAKSTDIDEMREFTSTALTLIDGEMQLHIETCAAVGISKAALAATREEPENLAYTRFVLDAGMQGDLLDLLCALIPCALGYGEIGGRLMAATHGRRDNHPYRDWIETYGGEDYQGFARSAASLANNLDVPPPSESHIPVSLCTVWRMRAAVCSSVSCPCRASAPFRLTG